MKTNKLLLILLLNIYFIGQLAAQQFTGGAQAGIMATQVAGDLSSGYNKIGLYAQVYAERAFTLKSSARIGLSFTQKGSHESSKERKEASLQYLLRVNYIELPIMYVYTLNKQFKLKGGLSYAYLIGSPHEESQYTSYTVSAGFNRHNLNIIIGIEYMLSPRFGFSMVSDNSITPIRPHASGAKRAFNRGQYSDALRFGLLYNF